jgi:YfiH family protein
MNKMTPSPLKPLQAEALAFRGIQHAFFTREGGVSSGLYHSLNGGLGSSDDSDNVHENRRRMADFMGTLSDTFLSLYQIHSPDVVTVTEPWSLHHRPKADAMVTRVEGLTLAIATADCGPILFVDPEARIIGAAHAGWKGALFGVLEATLQAMENIGASRHRITAVLGPTISQRIYEVGPEFKEHFLTVEKLYASFFKNGIKQEKSFFDLPGFIEHRLTKADIANFASLRQCTYSDEQRFFSYRRTTHRGEKDYGRLISAIALTS